MSAAAPVDYLTTEDLLEIAVGVVGEGVMVRDAGLLASAAARPQSSAFGEDAYRAFADKASALMHSLARNHPLIDGNKRLSWSATRIFCLLNGRDLEFTVDDAEDLVQSVARGELYAAQLAGVLEKHLVERAERF